MEEMHLMQSFKAVMALAVFLAASTVQAHPTAASPQEARAALNREQAEFARHQLAQNAANRVAYEEAVKSRADEIQHNQSAYQDAMTRWRADVAACQAGNVSHCAKSTRLSNPA